MDERFDVAILGAGKVGTALAGSFARGGARVTLGVKVPGPVQRKFEPLGICVATPAAALEGAEFVLLAVPHHTALATVAEHSDALRAKILIDANNPIAAGPDGVQWVPPACGSLAEALAAALPDTHVVKAFNTMGAGVHADPGGTGAPAQVFVAADAAHAKSRVMALASACGFAPLDAGPLRNASLLENLGALWVQLARFGGQGPNFVFGLRHPAK